LSGVPKAATAAAEDAPAKAAVAIAKVIDRILTRSSCSPLSKLRPPQGDARRSSSEGHSRTLAQAVLFLPASIVPSIVSRAKSNAVLHTRPDTPWTDGEPGLDRLRFTRQAHSGDHDDRTTSNAAPSTSARLSDPFLVSKLKPQLHVCVCAQNKGRDRSLGLRRTRANLLAAVFAHTDADSPIEGARSGGTLQCGDRR